ncbi:exonuclease V [Variovorax beijingensis]|uniref:Exonuclease V n=1 Tax=Variovorax beijingensis TaxID=2496117 RepID=A0A3P3E654_9BURK|nr:AAA family ATPase [Variovorax beijingensis]RRH81162.1 exonuclease V [Variovorax beijingensis]
MNRTIAAAVTVGVTVKSVVVSSELGGAIFGAQTLAGEHVRVVASGRAMHRPPVRGESWDVVGEYRYTPEFGRQLHARQCIYRPPRGRLLIQYLAGNPAFGGVGEAKATALFDAFGDELADVLSSGDVVALSEVLALDTAQRLVKAWDARRSEAELVDYLDTRGISPRLAGKIMRAWGTSALHMLEANPYFMLAFAEWGIVDAAARLTGVQPEDSRRLIGAVEAALYQELQSGHTLTDHQALCKIVRKLLANSMQEEALRLALEEGATVGSKEEGYQPLGAATLEMRIAERVRQMLARGNARQRMPFGTGHIDEAVEACVAKLEREQGFRFNGAQRDAVRLTSSSPFSLLLGGAGVGKTTVLRAVISVALQQGESVHQMALSGRAAKRMAEATQTPATTIAGFLSAVRTGKIELDGAGFLVVDEASMLDLPTMFRLLRHLPDDARMLLVGDPAQLPPIGFGLVFHRLADSSAVPHVELTEVHRQAASTGIPAIAAAIRRHDVPELDPCPIQGVGVSFVECLPDETIGALERLVANQANDWQILCAVKEGPSGIRAINSHFHGKNAVNHAITARFLPGDPVIHLVNDYEIGLMNGTLGMVVEHVSGPKASLLVEFEGAKHIFPLDDADERLELAYGISVHKAQGSQFERVAVVVSESRVLDHALIYTALTRGIRQVVFVGDRFAFERVVREAPLAQLRRTAFTV